MRRAATRRRAVTRMAALALAVGAPLMQMAPAATAQTRGASASVSEPGETLIRLFDEAREGAGDPHLPFVLNRLKRALSGQDAIGVLELVDPAYFQEQFGAMNAGAPNPGDALDRFTCELFALCDISKSYRLNDVISMVVLSAGPALGVQPTGDLSGATEVIEVRLEMRMWDGVTIQAPIFYKPGSAKIFGAVG